MKKFLFALLIVPQITFAFPANFRAFVCFIIGIIDSLIPLVAALTLLVFFFGLAKFIKNSGDTKNHAEGKNLMIWGLIGLFVMISVFGILRFAYNDFEFSDTRTFGVPTLPTGEDPVGPSCGNRGGGSVGDIKVISF